MSKLLDHREGEVVIRVEAQLPGFKADREAAVVELEPLVHLNDRSERCGYGPDPGESCSVPGAESLDRVTAHEPCGQDADEERDLEQARQRIVGSEYCIFDGPFQ